MCPKIPIYRLKIMAKLIKVCQWSGVKIGNGGNWNVEVEKIMGWTRMTGVVPINGSPSWAWERWQSSWSWRAIRHPTQAWIPHFVDFLMTDWPPGRVTTGMLLGQVVMTVKKTSFFFLFSLFFYCLFPLRLLTTKYPKYTNTIGIIL